MSKRSNDDDQQARIERAEKAMRESAEKERKSRDKGDDHPYNKIVGDDDD